MEDPATIASQKTSRAKVIGPRSPRTAHESARGSLAEAQHTAVCDSRDCAANGSDERQR